MMVVYTKTLIGIKIGRIGSSIFFNVIKQLIITFFSDWRNA